MGNQGLTVAIAITTYRNPGRLRNLLKNMEWAGIPDIPIYVFIDPPSLVATKEGDSKGVLQEIQDYRNVCWEWNIPARVAPKWGCMQGIIQFAFEQTSEDWLIYVPDDILFTKGGLYNEYGGVMTFGRSWVGGIQAPYWNADDLRDKSVLPEKDIVWQGWEVTGVPRNPHWDGEGVPRSYINLNGAGFSFSRAAWKRMGGWPYETWRLDEYAGYMTWKLGMCCLTLPGPPRIHYMGGATPMMPEGIDFASEEAWYGAVKRSISACGAELRAIMAQWGGDGIEFSSLQRYADRVRHA